MSRHTLYQARSSSGWKRERALFPRAFRRRRSISPSGKALRRRTVSGIRTADPALSVLIRNAAEISEVVASNPFPDAPPNRTVAMLLDESPPNDALERITGKDDEEVQLGKREIYVRYGANMGRSKLRIPAAKAGTARNINTVAKLADMAAEL
jgi:uncharacterized protein (DUF1697 family)